MPTIPVKYMDMICIYYESGKYKHSHLFFKVKVLRDKTFDKIINKCKAVVLTSVGPELRLTGNQKLVSRGTWSESGTH